MFELFNMGGPLFMGLITITFLIALIIGVRAVLRLSAAGAEELRHAAFLVRSIGLLALVIGVLGQLIGLYSAFAAIEQIGAVAPAMLAGGLKVSSITTIWGLMCYTITLLISLGLSAKAK